MAMIIVGCITRMPYYDYAPINVMPHYPPPGHHRGQDGDLTN